MQPIEITHLDENGDVKSASLPAVTGTGGTALTTDASGDYVGETTWSEPLLSQGSGGGVSVLEPRPSWQTGIGTGGQVEFRAEKAGIIHAGICKASFDDDKLVENAKALADAIQKAKPPGAKGTYVQKVALSSTMGPGVRVDATSLAG